MNNILICVYGIMSSGKTECKTCKKNGNRYRYCWDCGNECSSYKPGMIKRQTHTLCKCGLTKIYYNANYCGHCGVMFDKNWLLSYTYNNKFNKNGTENLTCIY